VREEAFTVQSSSVRYHAGERPEGVDRPFGALKHAGANEIVNAILGHSVGDEAPAKLVKQRFRWLLGFPVEDGAQFGASWSVFCAQNRMIGARGANYVRTRLQPYDWSQHEDNPVRPEPVYDREQALRNADRKAKRALDADQEQRVREILEERLRELK
jgi:hypothetical protein